MDGSTKITGTAVRTTAFFVTLVITAFIPVNTAQTYSETVSASCYRGAPEEGTLIGNLTVISAEEAGKSCNSLYASCEGKCTGCVSEFDFGGEICYDAAGKKFLK